MSQFPKIRWSNDWYALVLMLAVLVFGLRSLDNQVTRQQVLPISVQAVQADRILL